MMRETPSSSRGWSEYVAALKLTRGDTPSLRELTVRRPGLPGTRAVLAPAFPRDQVEVAEARPASGTELRPGVVYVDLTTLTIEEWKMVAPRLAATRGVVIDVRGYPRGPSLEVLAALRSEPMRSATWQLPLRTSPRDSDVVYVEQPWQTVPPAQLIAGRVVFLIDARAASRPETFLQVVRAYRLGDLVGEPTAGSNGNRLDLPVPGGAQISFTGLRDIDHDGSIFQGRPIAPTIPVRPTRAAIAAGRDEILERAVALFDSDGAAP
jgi:C-terminal processing protease CtpA/Prc